MESNYCWLIKLLLILENCCFYPKIEDYSHEIEYSSREIEDSITRQIHLRESMTYGLSFRGNRARHGDLINGEMERKVVLPMEIQFFRVR